MTDLFSSVNINTSFKDQLELTTNLKRFLENFVFHDTVKGFKSNIKLTVKF